MTLIIRNELISQYMSFIIFACFIFPILTEEVHPFRYKKGTITTSKGTIDVSGSAILQNDHTEISIEYYGMDPSTVTPFMIRAFAAKGGGNLRNNEKIQLDCMEGRWSNGATVKMSGTLVFTGNYEKAEIKANCIVRETREVWEVSSNEMEKKGIYFPYAEAGKRARLLLGESSTKYNQAAVISYALLDYPYTNLDCEIIANRFPDTDTTKPGILIVGKDKKHCGIIDDEGSKFIHSDPSKGMVVEIPLVLIERIFPEGYLLKAYPLNN